MWELRSSLFLLLHLFRIFHSITAIRKDVGFPEPRFCRTSVQGRYLLADDNGHVCDALALDPETRCCPSTGGQYSCQGCNTISQCCDSYEFCVSCCLDPARTRKEEVLKVKIAKPVTAGTYSSVFDYCAGRCRHNSDSVIHENAYLSDAHHCFSLPANYSGVTVPLMEARLGGITVVVGRQAQSCDSVCKSKGQSCVATKLVVLNQCEM
uniref:SREBP regulating gene protein n=1 Tax=Kalanchoe fedtschenkoi TaxID=63787 RepID=A0A7N0UQD8_KALFE